MHRFPEIQDGGRKTQNSSVAACIAANNNILVLMVNVFVHGRYGDTIGNILGYFPVAKSNMAALKPEVVFSQTRHQHNSGIRPARNIILVSRPMFSRTPYSMVLTPITQNAPFSGNPRFVYLSKFIILNCRVQLVWL